MNYERQRELAALTLRKPTAGLLTETEANRRAEDLRQRAHFFPHSGAKTTSPAGEAGRAFTADWQRMMERES